jgi:hypothetical protein
MMLPAPALAAMVGALGMPRLVLTEMPGVLVVMLLATLALLVGVLAAMPMAMLRLAVGVPALPRSPAPVGNACIALRSGLFEATFCDVLDGEGLMTGNFEWI